MKPGFFGQTYMYPTPGHGLREIGVTAGLGITWIVAWATDRGARHRIKTHLLPPGKNPVALQLALDAWAEKRGLDSVMRVAGVPNEPSEHLRPWPDDGSPSQSKVWLVIKWQPDGHHDFQGVFSSEARAVAACRTDTHCVCPATIGVELGQETRTWPGAWYPHRQPRPPNTPEKQLAQRRGGAEEATA